MSIMLVYLHHMFIKIPTTRPKHSVTWPEAVEPSPADENIHFDAKRREPRRDQREKRRARKSVFVPHLQRTLRLCRMGAGPGALRCLSSRAGCRKTLGRRGRPLPGREAASTRRVRGPSFHIASEEEALRGCQEPRASEKALARPAISWQTRPNRRPGAAGLRVLPFYCYYPVPRMTGLAPLCTTSDALAFTLCKQWWREGVKIGNAPASRDFSGEYHSGRRSRKDTDVPILI